MCLVFPFLNLAWCLVLLKKALIFLPLVWQAALRTSDSPEWGLVPRRQWIKNRTDSRFFLAQYLIITVSPSEASLLNRCVSSLFSIVLHH